MPGRESETRYNGDLTLLDSAAVLSESWIILVLLPIIMGITGYLYSSHKPVTYLASAEISIAIPATAIASDSDVVLGSDGKTLTASSLISEEDAKEKIDAAINGLRSMPVLNKRQTATVTLDIEGVKKALAELNQTDELLDKSAADPSFSRGEYARAKAVLIESIQRDEKQLRELANSVGAKVLSDDDQIELAVTATKPAKRNTAVLGLLGGLLLAVIYAFAKNAFKRARHDPTSSAKIDRIRRAFKLKSVP